MVKAGKSQGAPGAKSGGSFLLGMFVGLIVGLAVALGIAFYLNKTPIPFMSKSKAPATKDADAAKTPSQIAGMPSGKAPSGEKPKYDFYSILPGGEETLSEGELKAAVKTQPADVKSVYFLQAGAFQNPPDADNLKAKLAILGFDSTVEPATLPDKGTWYRVRVGPYTRVEELNTARSQLASNGIDASLIRIKNPAAAKP